MIKHLYLNMAVPSPFLKNHIFDIFDCKIPPQAVRCLVFCREHLFAVSLLSVQGSVSFRELQMPSSLTLQNLLVPAPIQPLSVVVFEYWKKKNHKTCYYFGGFCLLFVFWAFSGWYLLQIVLLPWWWMEIYLYFFSYFIIKDEGFHVCFKTGT